MFETIIVSVALIISIVFIYGLVSGVLERKNEFNKGKDNLDSTTGKTFEKRRY